MVREFPPGSDRNEALWPMFWAGRQGSCPFIRPTTSTKSVSKASVPTIPATQKHYARPNVINPLGENKSIVNRIIPEQPASGIINSSNAFSAIRSTTTCGSNITSALSRVPGNGGVNLASRQVRGLKSRLTTVEQVVDIRMDPPPVKKRKTETTLREQLAKTKKKVKREGYCENCRERYDDYEDVCPAF
jgi:hypothetical protein